MNPVLAFVIVMLVWTVSDLVAQRTRSLLSSLFVASIIFLVGFLTGLFPEDLLASSSLLALAGVVVGFVIVHLGTMISLDDFKKQWKTLLVGIATVIGIGLALLLAGFLFGPRISGSAADGYAQALDFVIAGTGALSGGAISVLIVQEAALGVGLTSIAVFPVLIAALQGLIGFPLTSVILRREAARLKAEYRAGTLAPVEVPGDDAPHDDAQQSRLPAPLRTTAGTLFVVGVVVLVSLGINNLTDGILNTFVVALILGIGLRTTRVLKPSVLSGIDAFGLMMIAVMILVFGPLATVKPSDVTALAGPLLIAFVFGVVGIAGFSALVGKLLGYSVPMSVAIGLTSLYGFPGTMILSQEAAKGAGETPEEVAAIEHEILPKMIVAGFSTVTITSVVITSIIAGRIGAG
ncbi:membrane protein [Terrabacter ginsenosidimutans]|uniref:Membrane protein n=1 Tax=Terrabacter ginsenosidimutans TaxID=490575 RepID=A0ABP7DAY8_9MICO